jgi:type I restriction enzyme, R subunit
MNEAETRAELIDPALKLAGWGVVGDSRVRRELIAPGRIRLAGRNDRGEVSDYVLVYRNQKLAVIEAKAFDKPDTEGLGQAKAYAKKLQVRFAISTNGQRIYSADLETGTEGYVDAFPTPDELWAAVNGSPNLWRDRFAASPSRITAACGSPAITRRSRFARCWTPSRRAAAGCC